MGKITEIIPSELPEWAVEAIENGQLFNEMLRRINRAEKALADSKQHFENSENPFYRGMEVINGYFKE